ncbi:hypothetical protein [Rhizobium sp. CC-YZS058]|uniref:hypothetical protein n=1 Tax=Rhizobium sp. CC-YZS058 TaxID=3042153 RepID=UPI002B06071B|nr:hypothetical protein [Rhizobium sp. CC-YZS058]MEA3537073.1 hypothetical protein [Rhizobium sp. CC-YZS058]
MAKSDTPEIELIRSWTLPASATLGSAVRAKGILLEIRARLPAPAKKSVDLEASNLTLAMPANAQTEFKAAAAIIARTMEAIDTLPVIPREIQDILTIKPSERHRWLADGRLPSAGTRTVRLNGRAKRITFHVFDPKVVEDILDRGAVDEWREEDAGAKAEKRREAAYRAKLTRILKKKAKISPPAKPNDPPTLLEGWEEFEGSGLLR